MQNIGLSVAEGVPSEYLVVLDLPICRIYEMLYFKRLNKVNEKKYYNDRADKN